MRNEQTTGSPMAPATGVLTRLRQTYLIMSLLLLVQFVLGMVVNLFVTIPTHHPGAQPRDYFSGVATSIGWAIPHGGRWLAVHVTLGLALVLVGLAALLIAIRCRRRGPITVAAIGLAAVVGAAFNGASFLNYNDDASSMIMAGCFALAVGCYLVGLYQSPPNESSADAPESSGASAQDRDQGR